MPDLVHTHTPYDRLPCAYKEQASAGADKATMSGLSPDVASPPYRYGPRVDRLELGLRRYGLQSEEPYARLCEALARLAEEGCFRSLRVKAIPPRAAHANGYKKAYCMEAGGREVASIICIPRKSYFNTPGAVIRMNCDVVNQLDLEEDFRQFLEMVLPGGMAAFITSIRLIELAYDVPARLADYVRWAGGNSKKTSHKTTSYLGNARSLVRLRCYDKASQLRACHHTNPQGDILRVECCLHRIPLADWRDTLRERRNILKALYFISKDELAQAFPPSTAPGLWNAAHSGNLTPAIQSMSESGQKRLKQRLKALPAPEWYRPDEIWEALLQAAEQCPWLP